MIVVTRSVKYEYKMAGTGDKEVDDKLADQLNVDMLLKEDVVEELFFASCAILRVDTIVEQAE